MNAPLTSVRPDRLDRAIADAYIQEILDRELGLTLHGVKVGSNRDAAMRELTKTAANLYASRVIRELIQNAYDGTLGAADPRIVICLDMRASPHGTLYIANDGEGFRWENVDAIVNPALSNKLPGNFIGHKGLGFRSVELLSDDPQIHSRGFNSSEPGFNGFRFRFATAQDERQWLEARDETEWAELVVGRTHRLQLPVVLDETSDDVRAFADKGFATLVKLPLRDAVALRKVNEELEALIQEKTPLALFLDRLSGLVIETVAATGEITRRPITRASKPLPVELGDSGITLHEVKIDRQRFLLAKAVIERGRFLSAVDHAVREQHPVERWRDWNGEATVSVAFALQGDARAGAYYAFLPTTKVAPFNGSLDGPFFPDADRKDVSLDNPLNALLVDVAAETCVAIADVFARNNDADADRAQVAVDALAWTDERERVLAALERNGREVDSLMLPSIRRPASIERWARLDEIFDWDDARHEIIKSAWLVRICDLPMLRRALGEKRTEALTAFIEDADFTFNAQPEAWAEWAPRLAADLAKRKKVPKHQWEAFYADLSRMPDILGHLVGKPIFRDDEGRLLHANGGANAAREVFISPAHDGPQPARSRPLARASMPPGRMASRLVLADPTLSWPREVVVAFVAKGLATEYSLARLLARAGTLIGKKPPRPSVIAALNWAFTAWREQKSTSIEAALKLSGLPVPLAKGGSAAPGSAYFSAGWRDTQGDLLADLCAQASDKSRPIAVLRDQLLVEWNDWPMKDKGGSGADWGVFLRLLGVRDGLNTVHFTQAPQEPWVWSSLKNTAAAPLPIERRLGPEWRQELARSSTATFRYQSGPYDAEKTIFALPAQLDHRTFTDAAKLAYARLAAKQLEALPDAYWTTRFKRIGGNPDHVSWPSPLLAFARRAAWVPVSRGDELDWTSPGACWWAPRSEPLPRFVRRVDRSVRDLIDSAPDFRKVMTEKLGLRLWNEPATARDRIIALGEILQAGINEVDHDTFRKEYREAWKDLCDAKIPPSLPQELILPVEIRGRLTFLKVSRSDVDRPVIFLGEGANTGLEQLVAALGHPLLTTPPGKAGTVAAFLTAPLGGRFTLPVGETGGEAERPASRGPGWQGAGVRPARLSRAPEAGRKPVRSAPGAEP